MTCLTVRQKPVEYQAQFYREDMPEEEASKLAEWAEATFDATSFMIRIPSIGGWIAALPGVHWILRHPNGAVSVCPTYSFDNIFDRVDDERCEADEQ